MSTTAPPAAGTPPPDQRLLLAMRDGVRLDTQVWLPASAADGPVPAILVRTPYKDGLLGFQRQASWRYLEAGYALVIQLVRGIGASEGHFSFNAPHERSDGYDTVEWLAAQPWCSGDVGMDGASYLAMTSIMAALAHPPHLRCIVPAVPSLDFFREPPYPGGVFNRQHTMRWALLLQIEAMAELGGGLAGLLPLLADPAGLQRMMSRPAVDAAEGLLKGDFLAHYRDVLAHPTFDDWWRARTASAEELAAIDIPTLVVSGNFDLGIGPQILWRGIEAQADGAEHRHLLIGPWDHGQTYSGGGSHYGPYELGESAVIDLPALRIAFFDRHLRRQGPGPELKGRATVFITGANEWRGFDAFPPSAVSAVSLYLASAGRANSARGDGRLLFDMPSDVHDLQPPDHFVDDPTLPHLSTVLEATGKGWDLRERERDHETLVYDSGVLNQPLTILGEPSVDLFTAADAPDADIVVFLAEHRADGSCIQLAGGQLRLRYREGFDAERALTPGEVVRVQVPMTSIGHRVPAGSRLRLLVCGSNFPFADPNPHTGEPIATAVVMGTAVQTVHHDAAHPSRLILPVLA